MKILAVGDAYVSTEYFKEACRKLEQRGAKVETAFWGPQERSELESINRKIETAGAQFDESLVKIQKLMVDKNMILVDFCPVPPELMRNQLKLIGVCRAGYSNVVTLEATSRGIPVVNVSGRNATAVAEFTVGLMLAESRHIARSHASLKLGIWQKQYQNPPMEIEEKVVGLIGFGAIGQKVAQKLSGFGCKIIFFDPMINQQMVGNLGQKVSLDKLLAQSDFVSVHCRLVNETKGLIGERELGLMKSSAYLINSARAEIVDQNALYLALKTGEIRGAALDVFPSEPLAQDHPFLGLSNITLTPHMAGSTPESLVKSPRMLVKNIIGFIDEKKHQNVVNFNSIQSNVLEQLSESLKL
jgi:D-3-phosphoglycerate dehydrogenase